MAHQPNLIQEWFTKYNNHYSKSIYTFIQFSQVQTQLGPANPYRRVYWGIHFHHKWVPMAPVIQGNKGAKKMHMHGTENNSVSIYLPPFFTYKERNPHNIGLILNLLNPTRCTIACNVSQVIIGTWKIPKNQFLPEQRILVQGAVQCFGNQSVTN